MLVVVDSGPGQPYAVVMKDTLVVGLLAGLVICGSVHSADAQADRQERHRVPADYMSFRGAQWLERAERVTEERPEEVLAAMGLQPGDVVADVGCGSGYYARRVARRVRPGGRVYCVDIQPEMLELMQQLADGEDVVGIEPVLSTPTDPQLPDGEIDWIIIADVYHEMSDPVPMLARMRDSLSSRGQIALLEYRVEDGTGDQIKADHTMSVRQVLSEWKAAGFALTRLHDFLPGQHLFLFQLANGNTNSSSRTMLDHDLFDALQRGLVETEAVGAGSDSVTIRIRRTGGDDFVVTSPVATYFRSTGKTRDMIARREGWIVLADDEWHEWRLRAVGRQRLREAPGAGDRLQILSPDTEPRFEELFYRIQVGTYVVADSPVLYPPRTHEIEQAALWIADEDADYGTLETGIQDPRVPPQYAIAFALVFCDLAGIEVKSRRMWADREQVFGVLRDRGLNAWYEVKTMGKLSR